MTLSIITINYNNHDGLQRTINSVLCQTWKDYEWIIIDGGSTDGSKELIEQYQEHFAYWCSEPDRGVYHAMNKGIVKAKGEYLIFLNSGDAFYNENVLDKVFNVERTADIITGQVVRSDNNQLLRKYDNNLLIQLYKDTLNHQGSFIKRDLFRNRRYDENLKVVSDWKFWIEAIVLCNAGVQVIEDVVAIQNMSGVSVINGELLLSERNKVKSEIFPHDLLYVLEDYLYIKSSAYYRRIHYLKTHYSFMYAMIRKALALILLLSGVGNKELQNEQQT